MNLSLNNRSVIMANQKLEDLPSDIRDQLADGSQQIFLAAFNSAQSDGLSEEAARKVAWDTVKYDYEQGDDGKWHRKPQPTNATRKAVPTGGN
jgi:cation transport regulator